MSNFCSVNNFQSPHIIIAVVYIFICLYIPVSRIVDTALNILENNDIFLYYVLE